ncbi:MAG: hypothetical protein WCY24_05300 [Lutispora sp.]|nr:hypothetical protein [Lutispora sp.]
MIRDGEHIRGDMYDKHIEFIKWAKEYDKLRVAEELFEYHYKKLGAEIMDTSIWASDSFRSIDPVYIHNYVMGASMAEGLIRYLKLSYGNDYESWGK